MCEIFKNIYFCVLFFDLHFSLQNYGFKGFKVYKAKQNESNTKLQMTGSDIIICRDDLELGGKGGYIGDI